MPARSSHSGAKVSPARMKARQDIASVFSRTLKRKRASHEAAARSMGVSKRTVGSVKRGETPLVLEVVWCSRLLGEAFREELCSRNHHAEKASAPYLAKKKASR